MLLTRLTVSGRRRSAALTSPSTLNAAASSLPAARRRLGIPTRRPLPRAPADRTILQHSTTPDHDAAGDATTTTHFGFRTVPEDVKESLVGGVFSNVADKYDVMNDVMSGGVHRLWKDLLCDIAFRFLDHVKAAYGANHAANVTVVDINPDMLKPAASPSKKATLSTSRPSPTPQSMPSRSRSAIRNCTHVDAVVREAYRVLKTGGRFMCLEFGSVENPIIRSIYDTYSFQVIPTLGGLIANDRDSYQYLVESIRRFPPQPAFARMIRDAGVPAARERLGGLDVWGRGGAFGLEALNREGDSHPPFVVH
ncbi:ubiE/COQ5 methyltransferase family-domain-containing protein [Zopfochytrium polystomum]|nr:ubiE/COQ5 methyltransferase family-domain-containing protein [Zopfochytrium polystomum]